MTRITRSQAHSALTMLFLFLLGLCITLGLGAAFGCGDLEQGEDTVQYLDQQPGTLVEGPAIVDDMTNLDDEEQAALFDLTPEQWLDRALEKTTLPSGYGFSGQSRCANSQTAGAWGATGCFAPANHFVAFTRIRPDTSHPALIDLVAFSAAKTDWINFINGKGWALIQDSEGASCTISNACVSFTYGPVGGTAIGKTSPFFDPANDKTFPAGKLHRYAIANIVVDSSKFPLISGWSTKTSTQQNNARHNVVLHELFHGVGLGHNTNNTTLMYITATDPFIYSSQIATTEEGQFLNDYKP